MPAKRRRFAMEASIAAAAAAAFASGPYRLRAFVAPSTDLASPAGLPVGQLGAVGASTTIPRSAASTCADFSAFAAPVLGAFGVAAAWAHSRCRSVSSAGRLTRRAESATSVAPVAPKVDSQGEGSKAAPGADGEMESPFEKSGEGVEKEKLPLTWENVQMVLDELRPYLQGDGGDCKIVDIDGTVVRLELEGACSSCSASSVTLKMGIEKTLRQRIPECTEVVAVMPEQEKLTNEGVEEVLNGIRPFLSVSGGEIKLLDLPEGEDSTKIVLEMTGPPLKSMAVRVEVVNRMKRKYPLVQDVDILGPDGKPAGSA